MHSSSQKCVFVSRSAADHDVLTITDGRHIDQSPSPGVAFSLRQTRATESNQLSGLFLEHYSNMNLDKFLENRTHKSGNKWVKI